MDKIQESEKSSMATSIQFQCCSSQLSFFLKSKIKKEIKKKRKRILKQHQLSEMTQGQREGCYGVLL